MLLLVTLLALPGVVRAQAADARLRAQREELDRVRRERADLEQRMANLQGSVHDLRDEVANLVAQRAATELVLKTLDLQLAAITNDVAEATNRVAMAEGDLMYRRTALSKRLVDIYKRGPLHATEALLTARSFGELVARYKYLHELAVHDRSLVKRVEILRNDIVRQRADLVKLRDAVEENRSDKLREEERLSILGRMRSTSLQQAQTTTTQIQERLARIRQSETRLSGVLSAIEADRRRTESARPNAPRAASTLRTTDVGKLDWPVDGTFLFRFGRVINPNNTTTRWNGVGIAAALGTPVKSVAAGSVVSVGQLGTYGLTVILDHGGGYFSIYASLNSVPPSLRKGTVLKKGDLIGTVGISDPDLKPHLHFEIRTPPNGNAVDPEGWLRGSR
ncbi:MAG: peptidoglycan DD-metalloendopeptidase family protein [Gemmatimonadota bacterium]|nr:peptidoglycan DD-metalloendopeptidase family protein [Gemmatimonadota bacterium]